MSDILILGTGGTLTDLAEILATPGYSNHRLLGYLDDDTAKHGTDIDGKPVLGGLACAADFPHALLILGIGSPRSYSRRLSLLAGLEDRSFLTVVHPTAWVSPSARLGQGCVVMAFSQVASNAVLEEHNIVLSHCAINHDAKLGRGTICASGVVVSGKVTVGESCYLGAGTILRDGVTVAPGVLTGAGAVVAANLTSAGVYAGVPARPLRS